MDPALGSVGEDIGFVMDDAMFEQLLSTQDFSSGPSHLVDAPSPVPLEFPADLAPAKSTVLQHPRTVAAPKPTTTDYFPLHPTMFTAVPDLILPVADGASSWLPNDIIEQVIRHSQLPDVQISLVPAQNPVSGQIYLFNKAITKKWRSDGVNWQRSEGGRIREHHENLKVGGIPTLNACYLRENYDETLDARPNTLTRRAYWLLNPGIPALDGVVLVHYLIDEARNKQILNRDKLAAATKERNCSDGKKRQRAVTPHRLEPPVEDEAAAVALQKVYRGSAVRQKLHRAEDGATVIQRSVRDFLARKQVKSDGAARVLQHAWKRVHRPRIPNRSGMNAHSIHSIIPPDNQQPCSIIPHDNQQPPGFSMSQHFEVKDEQVEWCPQVQTVTDTIAEIEIGDRQRGGLEARDLSATEIENRVMRQELVVLRAQVVERDAKLVEYDSELRLCRAMVAEMMQQRQDEIMQRQDPQSPTPSLPLPHTK